MEQSDNIHEHFIPQRMEASDAVIPKDSAIAEELEIIKYIAEKYEDDAEVELFVPHSEEEIKAFEERAGISLNDELRQFYLFTNGLCGMSIVEIHDLENVEGYYKMGYSDWAEEGDSEKYVWIGGDGGYTCLLMEKETGKLFRYYKEDDIIGVESFKDELLWTISDIYENICDNGEDEIIEEYLKRNAERM